MTLTRMVFCLNVPKGLEKMLDILPSVYSLLSYCSSFLQTSSNISYFTSQGLHDTYDNRLPWSGQSKTGSLGI